MRLTKLLYIQNTKEIRRVIISVQQSTFYALCSNSLQVYAFPPGCFFGFVRNKMIVTDISHLHQLIPDDLSVHGFKKFDLLPDEALCRCCIKWPVCPFAVSQLPAHVLEAIFQNFKPVFGVLVVELLEI